MRVEILGPLRALDESGDVVHLGGARVRALLARLAVDAGTAVTTGALYAAVWPDRAPEDPGHALQSLVSRLRAVLSGEAAVRAVPGGYRLDLPPEAVDAHRFERLAAEGGRALRAGDHDTAVLVLREALDLWRGEPLPELPDATALVARWNELRLNAIEDRIEAEPPYRAAELTAELSGLAAAYPLRERLCALLIRALTAAGRRAEALEAFERIRKRLGDRLGADPGPDLRSAHLAALKSESEPRRSNLKAPLTGLIGREREKARIAEHLGRGRLVTLVGPGGVGKTRLASAVAAELERPGGVWSVELAAVDDPDRVPAAAAAALDLRETGRPLDPSTRLSGALGGGEALLVLDNCEHVVEGAAALAAVLLARCPRLSILVTSREPLGITGEQLVPVLPLGPDAAARLFTERARAGSPGFAASEANAAQIARLCDRVDRLPLAIELAAARMRSMPLDTVLDRLSDRFALLTGGSRTALRRHQTLEAVVAWSWDLLDPPERAAAARLAVFVGGFTAGAADAVGAPVASLVDKSLVQFDGRRYRMLETIREYVLARSGGDRTAQAAHAAYFLSLAEEAAPRLQGRDQLHWLAVLNAEADNLGAAVDAACRAGDAGTAVRLSAALGHFWAVRGDHGAAVKRLLAALATPGDAPAEARGAAVAMCLFHALYAGNAEAVLGADPPLRPTDPIGESLRRLLVHDGTGPEPLGPEPEDHWKRGMFALVRSFHQGDAGALGDMRRELVGSAAAFREAGDRWGESSALTNAAIASAALGDTGRALHEIEAAVAVAGELGSDDLQRAFRGTILIAAGEPGRAREALKEVAGSAGGMAAAIAGGSLAELARHAGDPAEAERHLDGLADLAQGDPLLEAMLADGRGRLEVENGDLDRARGSFARSFTLSRGTGDMGMIAASAVGFAMVRTRSGDPASAAELLGAASPWDLATSSLDTHRLARELREQLGDGDFARAFERGRHLSRAQVLALLDAQTRR